MKCYIAPAVAFVCIAMLLSTAVAQDEKAPENNAPASDAPVDNAPVDTVEEKAAEPKQEFKLDVHAPNLEGFDPVSASTRLSADQRETIFDMIDTGNNQFAKKQYFAAAHAYKQAVEVDPDNVTLLKPLGRACVEAEFFDQAADALEPVHKATPEDKLASATLVRAYIGLLDQAMTENIFDSSQESDLVYAPAADLLRKIRAVEPEHMKVKTLSDKDGNVTVAAKIDTLRETAVALRKKRRNPIVAKRLERLIALAPQDYPALVMLAATYSDLRLYEKAEVTYRQAMAIKTSGEDQKRLDVYLNGQVRYAMDLEEFPKAIAALSKLREAHPNDPKFLIDLGRAYLGADEGKSQRSIETVRQAQSLVPTNSGVAIALAEIFKANSQMGQAVAALDSAAKAADNPGLVFKTLGDYHSEVAKVIILGRATARKEAAQKEAAQKTAAVKAATAALAATKAAAQQATKDKAAADAAVAQKVALAKTAADNATTTANAATTAATKATAAAKAAADKAAAAKVAADKAAAEKVATEKAATEKAAAEQVAAEKIAAEKAAAAKTAADKAAAAKTAVEVAAAEKTAAEKVAAEKTAVATAAPAKVTAAEAAAKKAGEVLAAANKSVADKTAAAKKIADLVASKKMPAYQEFDKATIGKAAAEKAAAEKTLSEMTPVAKAAADQVAPTKAAVDKAIAEKTAAEKAVPPLVATEKTTSEKADSEKVTTDKANAEKAAVEKVAAEKAVAAKTAKDKVAAENNEETVAAAKKAIEERAAADKVVAEKTAVAKTATDKYTAAKTVADKGTADKAAAEKLVADKTAAANGAAQNAAAAEAAAKKTATDLAVATRTVGEKTAFLEHVQRHAAKIKIGKRLDAEKLAAYRAYKNSGLVYAGLKQWNPALQSYGFAIKQNPTGDVEFFHNYALAYYNMPRRQTGGLNKAIGFLKQATKLDPKHLASHSLLGDVYMVPTGRRGTFNPQWTRLAIHSLLRAAELNPKDANIPYRLANVYNREKRFVKAYASYEKALSLAPANADYRRQYATTLIAERRYKTAIEKLDAKGERAASIPEQLVRGQALIGLERWKELQTLCTELQGQTKAKKLLGQINRLKVQAKRALAQRKQVDSEKLVVILFGDGGKAVDTWRAPERDAIPNLWNELRPLGELREAISLEGHYLPQDFATAIATGQWRPAPEGPTTFHQQIRPLLMQHCGECHHKGNAEGEFVVDDFEKMLKGGESYPDEAVVAGKSGESQLLTSILEGEMPPEERLTDKQITDLLKKWIDEGAQPGEKVASWEIETPTILERFRAARKVPAEKVWAIVGNEALDPIKASTSKQFGAKVAPAFVCVPRLQASVDKIQETITLAETRNLERAARLELINKLTPQDLEMPLENPAAAQLVTDLLKRDRHLDAADDRLVQAIATEVINKHKPDVLLVSFCNPRFGSSAEEIRRVDSSVFALWKQLQSIPKYRNNTNFVVVTPFPYAGSANVLSIGPRILANVVDRGEEMVYNRPSVLTEAMVSFANMLSIDYEIPEANLKPD